METLDIGQPLPRRAGPPEQLPLPWVETQEGALPGRRAARAASERDAIVERDAMIERATRHVRTVVLSLVGAILLASHFL